MSEKPYPAGTRVFISWGYDASYFGETGTALSDCMEAGELVFQDDGVARMPSDGQEVQWDNGARGFWPIAWLSPLSDPDAEPVIDEAKEEEPARAD